jgi:hypothetical protein
MGRTGFSWLRIGPMWRLCEYGNEPSGSIKKERLFSDKLNDYQLFKDYPAPWDKYFSWKKTRGIRHLGCGKIN